MRSIVCQHIRLNLIFDTRENGEGRQEGYGGGGYGGRRRVGNSCLIQLFEIGTTVYLYIIRLFYVLELQWLSDNRYILQG